MVLDPLDEFFFSARERSMPGEANLEPHAAPAVRVEMLAFFVAEEEYALEITEVQEIVKVPEITEVPRTPPFMLGITSLRGTIVPIIDLRTILQLAPRPVSSGSRVLVLRGGGDPLGILVDRVSSVVRLDRDAVEPVPRAVQRAASELLRGVGRPGDRLVIILDAAAVLRLLESA